MRCQAPQNFKDFKLMQIWKQTTCWIRSTRLIWSKLCMFGGNAQINPLEHDFFLLKVFFSSRSEFCLLINFFLWGPRVSSEFLTQKLVGFKVFRRFENKRRSIWSIERNVGALAYGNSFGFQVCWTSCLPGEALIPLPFELFLKELMMTNAFFRWIWVPL